MNILLIIGLVAGFIFVFLYLYWKVVFLRNPERSIPAGNNLVSPADGKIVDVLEFENNSVTMFKNDKRYKGIIHTLTSDVSPKGKIVSIFMSPLDVHYNRTPMAGTVKSVVHTKGKFLPVNTLKAGLVNEKAEILIESEDMTIKVVQIAGFLAKRIETFVKPGDVLDKGDIIGLINLGSQALLVVPDHVNIQVAKGDKVKAGESKIAQVSI